MSSKKTASEERSTPISFGARRYSSKGPRRLFVPEKCLVSPVFEPTPRQHSLLRPI